MLRNLVILMVLLNSFPLFAQKETITNQSVMDLYSVGFSDSLIIAKINTSDCNFNTEIDTLKVLKEKGLSEAVIITMLGKLKEDASEDIQEKEEINSETDRLGIYNNQRGELIRILPTVFSGTKTNTLGSAFSYGIASSNIKSVLNNPTSSNVVENNQPEFIFFFPSSNNTSNMGWNNWWFFSATSPNEFVLVKLDVRGRKRELKTGSVNLYAGMNIGVDENYIIPFDIIPVNEYTYKVVPKNSLEPGEYCFFYQGTIPQGGFTNQSVFDFSIRQYYGIMPKYKKGDEVWVWRKNKPCRCEVDKIEIKEDGVFYLVYLGDTYKTATFAELDCYPSKEDLIKSDFND